MRLNFPRRLLNLCISLLRYCMARARIISYVEISGVKLFVNSPEISPRVLWSLCDKSYEHDEYLILSKYIGQVQNILEIGAGIGFLSAFCALQGKSITAVEALPALCNLAKQNYAANNVSPNLLNYALAEKSFESIKIARSLNFWSSSCVQSRWNPSDKIIEIESISLRHLLSKYMPEMLIIDIEGGETLLSDLDWTSVSPPDYIIVELHPHVISSAKITNIFSTLIARSYIIDLIVSRHNIYLFRLATEAQIYTPVT